MQQAGYRLTQPRRAVLEAIAQARTALTPTEIHCLARGHYAPTGLVTVYRTLNLLVELGVIRRLPTEEGHAYMRADLQHPGHHLVCQSCHRTVEFPCSGLGEMIEAMEQQTGYTIQDHWLELFGLCPACQGKKSDSPPKVSKV